MPTLLSPYTSQQAERVNGRPLPADVARSADASGLVQGVAQGVNTFERMQETQQRLQEVQQHLADQQKADEAKVRITNTVGLGQADWTERLQRAQTAAPSGAKGFTETTLKDFDEWKGKQLEGETDPAARRLLDSQLSHMRLSIHAEAFKFEVGARNKGLVQDFDTGTDADRRAVMADPSRFVETRARRVGAAQSLNLPPEVRGKLAQDASENLAFDAANGLVDQNPAAFLERAGMRSAKGGKGKPGERADDAAARIAADPILSSMAPEKLRQVTDRASVLVSQQEQAAQMAQLRAMAEQDRRLKLAEAEYNTFQSMSDKGTLLDPGYVSRVTKATAGTPYQAGVVELARMSRETGGIAAQPLASQRALLTEVDGMIAQSGRSPALDKRREQLEKVVKGTEQDLQQQGGLRAGLQRGWITDIPALDMSTGLAGVAPQLAPRVAAADQVASRTGRPESPFTPDEAATIGRQITALPAAQRGAAVASLSAGMPAAQAAAVGAQIDGHDRTLGLMFKAGASKTTQGRYTADLMAIGSQALADTKAAKVGDKGDNARQQLRADIVKQIDGEQFNSGALSGPARDDIIDAAILVHAGLTAVGSTRSANAEGAVNLAIGGNFADHNGKRLPLPAGVGIDNLRDRLRAYPESDIAAQSVGGYVVRPGGRPMGVPEFLSTLPDAQLIPAGLGTYYVRSGSGVATGANSAPIVIKAR